MSPARRMKRLPRLRPSRRFWVLLAVGAVCTAYGLLALAGPLQIGPWHVHLAVLSPLLAGALLGGVRGFLTQLAVGAIVVAVPGRFAGALASPAAALADVEFVALLGFPLVPVVVSATLTERRRYSAGWMLLSLVNGMAVVYGVAVAALIAGRVLLPAAGEGAPRAFAAAARAAVARLPGDAALVAVAFGATMVVGLPTRLRRRREARAAALHGLEQTNAACELLVLDGVADLVVQERSGLQQRSPGREDDPLVSRLSRELERLEQSLAGRIGRLERTLSQGGGRAPGEETERFRRLLTPAYLRERCDDLLGTLRLFRTASHGESGAHEPDVKAALDRVGRYFSASTGGVGGSGEGSLDGRQESALRLKDEMETDYRRRADEVAALTRQAEDLAADLRHLRDLWQEGVVSASIWTAQQQAFAPLLERTHRQIDLRRRVLAIYRRAEPPLDLA